MFSGILRENETFQKLKKALKQDRLIQLKNLEKGPKTLFYWGTGLEAGRLIILTGGSQEASALFEELVQMDGDRVLYFPAEEVLPHEGVPTDISLRRERMEVLHRLAVTGEDFLLVAPVQALLQALIPPRVFNDHTLHLQVGSTHEVSRILKNLQRAGYERVPQVESWGQFARRGGILDVFPLTGDLPIRIEFFDDEIDSIRSFDIGSQRSRDRLDAVAIPPASEQIIPLKNQEALQEISRAKKEEQARLEREKKGQEAEYLREKTGADLELLQQGQLPPGGGQYLPYFYPSLSSLFDYAGDSPVLLDNPRFIDQRAQNYSLEMAETEISLREQGSVLPAYGQNFLDLPVLMDHQEQPQFILVNEDPPPEWSITVPGAIRVEARGVENFSGNLKKLIAAIQSARKEGYRVGLSFSTTARISRVQEHLEGANLPCSIIQGEEALSARSINILKSTLSNGFNLPRERIIWWSEQDIFGKQRRRRRKVQDLQEGIKVSSFQELNPGDYVVHENHGVGKYLGVQTEKVLDVHQDYLVIKYAGEDRLYVPTHQIDLIQKYVGLEDQPPRLYRLGGGDWNRVKKRVKESVQEMARGLLKLYAERESARGYQYSSDTVWQKEFEEAFPYEETPDQIKGVEEIKKDMEDSRPMDRLLCGDVGYGKTEVAIRASFKAVMEGKQVAVLVPTTILAQQHFNTFLERFEDYPVNIEMVSRFRSPARQKEIMKKLGGGKLDIVIGTHRLLSRDVSFRDLGLLIVDEEQRFGVGHKEKIKELKKNVDVLTLTATPIPRTLHMSMVGMRDMSQIETPPRDRYPIRTYVREYDRELIREAIQREMAREGQIYFVHNRVEDIQDRADEIRRLVPEARIAVAHGQMAEKRLEQLMLSFLQQDYDVLVCTTIIETGMDIPNVNTIIVNNADQMGLAQLYQLRGRVGRSNRVAYAYLLHRQGKVLAEDSEKRLMAIKEFTNLGSGFKLAMRDLEIRGAGNILGPEQHGHIAAVGFTLYCKLLEETMQEMSGEKKKEIPTEDIVVDADWDAYIPEDYIPDARQKVEIYKKISELQSDEDQSDLLDELIDRFGDPPQPVLNLLYIARLRYRAGEKKLTEIRLRKDKAHIYLSPEIPQLGEKIVDLGEKYRHRIRIRGSRNPQIVLDVKGLEDREVKRTLDEVLAGL